MGCYTVGGLAETAAQTKGRGDAVVALNSGLWSEERHSFLGQRMDEYGQEGMHFINHVSTYWHVSLRRRQDFADKGSCMYMWGMTSPCTLLILKHYPLLRFTWL